MSRQDDIEKGLLRVEHFAQQLLQASLETRALMKEAGVSTPANSQPLTEQQLASITARRRQRIMRPKK